LLGVRVYFVKKPSIPEYTGFEIGKTGIIPVSVLTFQYRIGNTSCTYYYGWVETDFVTINATTRNENMVVVAAHFIYQTQLIQNS
jgi:hypothetical protein